MDQRRKRIIDKKFQLNTTYSVMSIFFIIIVLIIAVIGINFYNDNKKINAIIEEQKNIVNAQTETINSMLQILNIKYGNEIELSKKIREKDAQYGILMKNNINLLKELTERNNIIFFIVIVFLISCGFILYPVLIRKTHKISGPIYLMSEYIKDILNGGDPELRPLRKKDELKEFYALFSKLVSDIKIKRGNNR